MPKKYQLLIDSPEYPKGTIAQQINENGIVYQLSMLGVECASELYAIHIENRPTVWQEIVEEPEKKIVERWRAKKGHDYYAKTSTVFQEKNRCVDDAHYYSGDYFQHAKVSARAKNRVVIMCRLMGLAETIEEGSTEMKRAWTIGFDIAKDMDLIPIYTNNTVLNTSKLATFNTKENTQLFLDSAGQDALDWYGEVK